MPGRKAAVTSSEILNHLIKFDIYDDDKNTILKNRNNDVWVKICDCVNNLMKPVALYVSVFQDRHNIHTLYRKSRGLLNLLDVQEEKVEQLKESKEDTSESCESDKDSDADFNPIKKPKLSIKNKLEFSMNLTSEEWNLICPINVNTKNGNEKSVLKEGWTDVIRDAIWKAKKLPCSYSFKRHSIKKTYPYIEIEGLCTSCQVEIYIACIKEPNSEEPVTFSVLTTDSTDFPHNKKTRLQKKQKLKIEKELLHKQPKQWRRDHAKIKMELGDPEPATLYNLKQLQRAKQDAKCKELGLLPRQDLFVSLSQMKNNPEFSKFIKDIGFNRFFILYWSPEQVRIYNEIVEFLENPVSLDSTGSVTLKIKRDGDSSHVFLSVLCTNVGKMIVPITQCMSERNDTPFINFWLNSWLQSGADIPKELVTDMGKALQNGACLAFNSLNFSAYNDVCLQILLGEKIPFKLNTQLRTDIAHLIHAITRWSCFSICNKSSRILYRKCIGYMTTITELNVFKYFLEQVLIVSSSKNHTDDCGQALTFLVKTIETYKLSEDILIIDAAENNLLVLNDIEENKNEDDRLTTKYIENIKNEILTNINNLNKSFVGMQSNDYYLPDFRDKLLNLSKDFPSWTNVMNGYFNNPRVIATSARSEAYFGEFKKTLENAILREDKVLVIHCRNLESDMILARAALDNLKKELQLQPKTIKVNKKFLMETEKWKNKGYEVEQIEILDDTTVEETKFIDTSLLKEIDKEKNVHVTYDKELEAVIEIDNKNKSNLEENSTISDLSLIDHDYMNLTADTRSNSKQKIDHINTMSDKEEKLKNNSCFTHGSENESTKNRGIYVSPDPELYLRLQKPDGVNKSKGVLKNGSKMQPRRMLKQTVIFNNTCSFDSLTEIFSSACCNIRSFYKVLERYKNTIKSKKDTHKCYATTVYDYAISGINNLLYIKRAHLLYSIFSIKNSVVDCNTNIAALLSNLWSQYETTIETLNCTLCNTQEEIRKTFIFIPNLKIAWIHKYNNLEEQLNNYFKNDTNFCRNCLERSVSSNHKLGPFLYIDCDEVYRPSYYAKSLGIDGESFTTNLKEIPEEITVSNEKFILCGVIKYLAPIVSNGMGHYIALCRSIHGIWEEKNDLHTYKLKLNKNRNSVLPNIQISGIFYVKYTQTDK